MKNILKKMGYTSILQDVLLVMFGILLLNMTFIFSDILAISIAAFFILKGVIKICKYIIAKGVSEFYKDEILFGIISILLGIFIIVAKSLILWVFRLGIGIYIIYGAIEDVVIALKLKKLGVGIWVPIFVIAIITAIFGIGVLLYKGLLIKTSAFIIIGYAAVNIIQTVLFLKNSNEIFK